MEHKPAETDTTPLGLIQVLFLLARNGVLLYFSVRKECTLVSDLLAVVVLMILLHCGGRGKVETPRRAVAGITGNRVTVSHKPSICRTKFTGRQKQQHPLL